MAVNITCTLHDQLNKLAKLKEEIPKDVEISVLLEVWKQITNNSCRWVSQGYFYEKYNCKKKTKEDIQYPAC